MGLAVFCYAAKKRLWSWLARFDFAALAAAELADLESCLASVKTVLPLVGVTYDVSSRLSDLVFVRRRTRLAGPLADGSGTTPTIFFRAWIQNACVGYSYGGKYIHMYIYIYIMSIYMYMCIYKYVYIYI